MFSVETKVHMYIHLVTDRSFSDRSITSNALNNVVEWGQLLKWHKCLDDWAALLLDNYGDEGYEQNIQMWFSGNAAVPTIANCGRHLQWTLNNSTSSDRRTCPS